MRLQTHSMMLFLEIIAFIAAIVLGVFWIVVPDRNWEPWIVLCGSVTLAVELSRRFGPKKESQTSSVTIRGPYCAKNKDHTTRWLEDNVHTAELSESLPRALQFAKRIGNTRLERWVRLELYGYNRDAGMADDDVVPKYRVVTGRWMDQFDRMLDISHDPGISIVNEYPFRFAAAELEQLASKQEMQNIADEYMINVLRENLDVEVIRFCFSPIEVRGVLDTIRNKLAEMVLDCLSDAKTDA